MSYLISSLQDRLFPAITHYQIVIVLREAISVKLACLHVHTPRVVRIQHIVNPPLPYNVHYNYYYVYIHVGGLC